MPGFRQTVKTRDVVIFTRQLTTMIDAGMPLVQILDILATQSDNKTFANQIREVKESVEAGSTLSDALRKFPKSFDELYVNMVQAGEVGGILDTILGRLSIYMEKMMSLKRKIKGAMIYPGDDHHRRGGRHPDPAGLRDPGLRRAVQQLRQGAARADADRHQHLELRDRLPALHGGGRGPVGGRDPAGRTRPSAAGSPSTA